MAITRFILGVLLTLATSASAFAQGGVLFTDGIRFNVSAQSVADNGGGTAATGTIEVLRSYVLLTCSDTDGCTMTMGESGARDGFVMVIVNTSANTATFNSSSGVLELDTTVALGQYDTLSLIYRTDRWVQFGASGGGGSGAPTSSQYVTLATDGTLSNERVLTAGTGISVTDGGAGSTVTVALSGGTVDATTELSGAVPVANGGTNLTSAADDNVMLGNGTTWQSKALTDCDNVTTSKLLYDTTTNAFSCGTDGTGGAVNLATNVTGTLPVANGGTNLTASADDNVMVGNGTTWQSKSVPDCDTAGTSKLLYDQSTNAWSCGTDQTSGNSARTLGLTIDGSGGTITTGVKGFVVSPVTCTLTQATLLSTDASATVGSIVIDVWKDTYANYPPTNADSIAASAKPTLSSANKSQDSTLTGWTTSVTAGDVLGFEVESASTVTRVALFLTCQ